MRLREQFAGDLLGFARAMGLTADMDIRHQLKRIAAGEQRIGTTWRRWDLKKAAHLQAVVAIWRLLMYNDGSSVLLVPSQNAAVPWFLQLAVLRNRTQAQIQRELAVFNNHTGLQDHAGNVLREPNITWVSVWEPQLLEEMVHRHLTIIVPNVDHVPTETMERALKVVGEHPERLFMGHLPKHARTKSLA